MPLPPPRPAMDYSKMAAEVDANPALVGQMAAMGQGELPPNASLQQRQIQAQTALNRAQANNLPLSTALNNGYYPPQTFQRGTGDVGAYKRDVLDPLLRGADPSSEALGFPASQNASNAPGNPVAANGIASGRYRPYAWMGGEMYGQKAGEGAALERFRNPFGPPARGDVAAAAPPDATAQGRDAITEAALAGAQPPVSNARVASLGGAGPLGAAGAASNAIPPTLPPSMPPPVPGGPAGAVPPAPYANPPTPTDIAPRPQVAQAQVPPPPPPAGQPFSPRTVPLSDAKPPDQTPISDNEKLATLQMIRAQNSGDVGRANTWKTVVDQLAAKRLFLDKQNEEMWKARTGRATTDISAAQAASRQHELLGAKGELPQRDRRPCLREPSIRV